MLLSFSHVVHNYTFSIRHRPAMKTNAAHLVQSLNPVSDPRQEASAVDADVAIQTPKEELLASPPDWLRTFLEQLMVPLHWNAWQARLAAERRRQCLLRVKFSCPKQFTTGDFYKNSMHSKFGSNWQEKLRRQERSQCARNMKAQSKDKRLRTFMQKTLALAEEVESLVVAGKPLEDLIPLVQQLIAHIRYSAPLLLPSSKTTTANRKSLPSTNTDHT